LSLLDRMHPGLGTDVARFGVLWQGRRTFFRGRQVYLRNFAPHAPDGLPPFTSLRQVDTERFLFDACVESGVVFHWDADVRSVAVYRDGATLTSVDSRTWTAGYVVAADGA